MAKKTKKKARRKPPKRGPLQRSKPKEPNAAWSEWKRAEFSAEYRKKLADGTAHGEPDEIWVNNTYQVMVFKKCEVVGKWPPMGWLSMRRVDKTPITSWEDMQRIKNELFGPEHEAVELFPAEMRRVDTRINRHMWVFAKAAPSFAFPFGFTRGEAHQPPEAPEDAPEAKVTAVQPKDVDAASKVFFRQDEWEFEDGEMLPSGWYFCGWYFGDTEDRVLHGPYGTKGECEKGCVEYFCSVEPTRHCSVCDEPQFDTLSGQICVNGHGSAPSKEEE